MSSALTAAGLGKRYGRKWALRGCTVEIPDGHVVGLVGPNGAGKSTLLNLMVGLLAFCAGPCFALGASLARSDHLSADGVDCVAVCSLSRGSAFSRPSFLTIQSANFGPIRLLRTPSASWPMSPRPLAR